MAGIKDIAKKAGVSISTVSYALNNNPKVTEITRKKIIAVANEMGYVPNGAARMLRARETKIIGVFLEDYSGTFYGQLLKGMRETLNKQGYELVVCSGRQSRRLLLEKMMDGAIILDGSFSDQELLTYADQGHRIIVLDRDLKHKNIKTVLLDNAKGAELAIMELLKNKVSDLWVITGPDKSYDSKERIMGMNQAMKLFPNIKIHQFNGAFSKSSGEKAARKIMNNILKPVAIFCLNDEMAVGVYDYIKKTDFKIGRDVYIVGFDNIELSKYLNPRLTTVDYSAFEWGALATTNLLKLISDQPTKNEKIAVEFIKGESC